MLDLLKKPYPYFSSFKENFIILLCVSLFVVLFVWFFRPLNDLIELNNLKIAGYGAITFVIAFSIFFGLPILFPGYHSPDGWTVGKEIFRLTLVILFISIGNYFYSVPFLIEGQNSFLSIQHLLRSISTTLSIGIIPIIVIVLYNQNRLLKKYIKESAEMNTHLSEKPRAKQEEITIIGEGKNEQVQLNSNDLLYIKSDGNYCEVVTKKNKIILRISLLNLEQQLEPSKEIVKVHRSYLVNLALINKISGNAQGYRLHFLDCNEEIPVSRNNSEKVKHLFA